MCFLHSDDFKEKARKLQIDQIGIAAVKPVDETTRKRFTDYLSQGRHARMGYLERHIGKRLDPSLLFPGAKSAVVILCGYLQAEGTPRHPHISLYAQGTDYHLYVKEKLSALADGLPPGSFRCLCDTAPLLEKYWARQAGLGFIGRNSLLLNPQLGSYCFIGVLLTRNGFDRYDTPLVETPERPHPCAGCRRCEQTCPAGALNEGLDANKCLSYITIESKDERPSLPACCWFGCDACQTACPANAHVRRPGHEAFRATEALLSLSKEKISDMQPCEFEEKFQNSPLLRAGLDGLRKNIRASAPATSTNHQSKIIDIP